MSINLEFIFKSSSNSEKTSDCQMKEKYSCLNALAWLELVEGYLNVVTKQL